MSLITEYQKLVLNGQVTDLNKISKLCLKYSKGVSDSLKQRFCKDWDIPIRITTEPYFSERLAIYNQYKACIERFGEYIELVERLGGEQKYYELYNTTKDKAINYLNSNSDMVFFKESEDMKKFKALEGFTSNAIYKQTFIGKKFISIDLRKGNFTALKYYNPAIVGDCETYELFMAMFTEEPYLRESKYIRQVIFGNVNPKRQVTYEKYLMSMILTSLFEIVPVETVASFSSDEIVLDADAYTYEVLKQVVGIVEEHKKQGINARVEYFELDYVAEADTYCKLFLPKKGMKKEVQLKGMSHTMMPYMVKALYRNKISEHDQVFELEGKLAKWLVPNKISSKGLPRVKYSWEV